MAANSPLAACGTGRQVPRMASPHYRVGSPPAPRPLLIFDGDCRFCAAWVARWRAAYGHSLDFAPAQEVRSRFPEIPAGAFAAALQFVETDGAVYAGAEAALRARARGRGRFGLLLRLYEKLPGAAPLLEFGYRIVARNRRIFSMLMR
jgi:predicted DCC family thiol-disulfide oxidoreductase YuxK